MAPSDLQEQLVKYLTDAHAIEQQALVQMRVAPRLAGEARVAELFRGHLIETMDHERMVGSLLERHGAQPSKLKDLAGALSGAGFGVFAAVQPDTPGKLVVHAFSYEHMEEAAHHLLSLLAQRLDDSETAAMVREIEGQERDMAQSLADCFDVAVAAALDALGPADLRAQVVSYLTDAHAIEAQSLKLLEKGTEIAGVPALATVYERHHVESLEHQRLLRDAMERRDVGPSRLKDAALKLGALNWGMFFQAQPDTPAKLAAFSYAFENLEVAAYEMLQRVAQRAREDDVGTLAAHILGEERAAAEKIWKLLAPALDASLQAQGVAVS